MKTDRNKNLNSEFFTGGNRENGEGNSDYTKTAERVFLLMALIAAAVIVVTLCQGASYQLVWNSKETTNTVYEIWRGTNATGPFSPWAIVAETRAPMPTGEPMGFFVVRASNTVTHLVSEWSSRP